MAQCARTRVRWAWLAVAAVAWLVVDAPLPVAAQWCGGKDCYGVLGVQPDATARQIRSAYRSLSLKHHPDKNPDDQAGAAQRFQAIAAAYEVLSDEVRRRRRCAAAPLCLTCVAVVCACVGARSCAGHRCRARARTTTGPGRIPRRHG